MKILTAAIICLALALSAVQTQAADAFILIRGGTFDMGSPFSEHRREKDERRHNVTLNPFYMGVHEVTQKEYRELMGNDPSQFKGDDLPVENVSWYDAVATATPKAPPKGWPRLM